MLCAFSRDHDRALVIFVLTMSQFIFIYLHLSSFFCPIDWLLSLFLMNSSFHFSFFVSSFNPPTPQSRFHLNLAKALLASLYMRTTIFLSSCIRLRRYSWKNLVFTSTNIVPVGDNTVTSDHFSRRRWLDVSHSQTEHLSCGTCFPGRCKPPVPC